MKTNSRFVLFAGIAIAAAGSFMAISPAHAQGRPPIVTTASTGFVANPLFDKGSLQGTNPFYESSQRFSFGGGDSTLQVQYSIDIDILEEDWDGKQMLHSHHIIHRDLAARAAEVHVIDFYTTETGLEASFNRGPRQTISLDSTFSPDSSRMSMNVTIERSSPRADFGRARLTVQSFVGNHGGVALSSRFQ